MIIPNNPPAFAPPWDAFFAELEKLYQTDFAKLAVSLESTMQALRETEINNLNLHKKSVQDAWEEYKNIKPKDAASFEKLVSKENKCNADWAETVTKHEAHCNGVLSQHAKCCETLSKQHEARWAEAQKRYYLSSIRKTHPNLTTDKKWAANHFVFAQTSVQAYDKKPTIAICIITYKRPDSLRTSIEAIRKIILPEHAKVRLVVVDNDFQESAWTTILPLLNDFPMPIEYSIENNRGIPYARNKALQIAAADDYIAFVDDDDIADQNWLVTLFETARSTKADVVKGQVIYTFPPKKQHLLQWDIFAPMPGKTGYLLESAWTNNVLFATHICSLLDLKFDMRFLRTGGSDHHFFHGAWLQGAKIVFCREAVVYSPVSEKRARKVWIARRYMRIGATANISTIKHFGYLYALKNSVYTAHKLTYMSPFLLLGRIMGLFYLSPREYL